MSEFHLLRPWWLAALPLVVWLIWRLFGGRHAKGKWPEVVDRPLQPHVLSTSGSVRARSRPAILAGLASVVAIVALAGPSWERLPVPAFRSDEALVVVMDLSRSMDATDLEPSRLARAKLKLLSLLERRPSGQTALVVFSGHAFTVTPLTSDTRTISSLVIALSTDIMPSPGSNVAVGLDKAGALLRQTGLTAGEILLISDADVSPRDLDVARELRDESYLTHVLAIGTEEGAPIPDAGGGFMTDSAGQLVIPGVDRAGLRRLANAGGGRYAQSTAGDGDLDRLFPMQPDVGGISDEADQGFEIDVWRDEGIWLALLLLPLLALGFRRGWICLVLIWLAWPAPPAGAFEWRDLWQRPDQQAYEAMQADQAARAASLFDDDEWRAAAQYRIGDFAASADSLAGIDAAEAHYNRGNALARGGDLQAAISAYDRALELKPDDEDAAYNRELVSRLLEQNPEQQQQQQSQQGQGQDENSGDEQQQGDDSSQGGEQSEDGEQSEQSQSDGNDQGQQAQNDASQSSDDAGRDSPEPQDADGEQQQGEQQRQAGAEPQDALGPDDVEQWASEQAADQWLRRVPQDPGGLLRRKFLYQYQRLGIDQDGNYVWSGDEDRPW